MEETAARIAAIMDTYDMTDAGGDYETILETLVNDPAAIIHFLLDRLEEETA